MLIYAWANQQSAIENLKLRAAKRNNHGWEDFFTELSQSCLKQHFGTWHLKPAQPEKIRERTKRRQEKRKEERERERERENKKARKKKKREGRNKRKNRGGKKRRLTSPRPPPVLSLSSLLLL
jgi:hypothetical protein